MQNDEISIRLRHDLVISMTTLNFLFFFFYYFDFFWSKLKTNRPKRLPKSVKTNLLSSTARADTGFEPAFSIRNFIREYAFDIIR